MLALVEESLQRRPNRLVAQWGESAGQGWPEGWTRTGPGVVDRVVVRLLRAERVKRAAVPEGSRRQVYVRRSVNWLRERVR